MQILIIDHSYPLSPSPHPSSPQQPLNLNSDPSPNLNPETADPIGSLPAIQEFLTANGHTVITINSSAAALEFLHNNPALVALILIKLDLPELHGYETATQIRALQLQFQSQAESTELAANQQLAERNFYQNSAKLQFAHWIPIVFLSPAELASQMVTAGIAAGGDDHLFIPLTATALNAKLLAIEKLQHMRQTILAEKAQLIQITQELFQEQNFAKSVYNNMIQNGVQQKYEFLRTYVASKSIFNGDLALIAKNSADHYYMIMGDFTGHGLSAALGIIPTAEIFFKLTMQGFTLEQLLIELNATLHNILPTNIFCAAALLDLDFTRKQLAVWNGWAPEVLCVAADGGIKKAFPSTNMPLGYLPKEKFNCKLDFINLTTGDQVYVYSDGFLEIKNAAGQMFGAEGVRSSIQASYLQDQALDPFDLIIENALNFKGKEGRQEDDMTLIEIKF